MGWPERPCYFSLPLQGKTYQRQFPQRFAAGSVRESQLLPCLPLLCRWVLACGLALRRLQLPPFLPLRILHGMPWLTLPGLPAHAVHSCCLPFCYASHAAVVRERVYDIRRVVTVTEGEPMEMES